MTIYKIHIGAPPPADQDSVVFLGDFISSPRDNALQAPANLPPESRANDARDMIVDAQKWVAPPSDKSAYANAKIAAPQPSLSFVTAPALPNEVYNVTPVVKFFVTDGAYTPGAVIDYSAVSASSAAIDFTGRPWTTATVAKTADGLFPVTDS